MKYALLGLLAERDMTGYDLKHMLDSSGLWSADQSQIYRTLASLVEGGLATRRTVVQHDRPNQHPHSITVAGTRDLDAWLSGPLEVMPGERDPFLVRLRFLGRLGAGEARRTLAARRGEILALQASLHEDRWPRGARLDFALQYATRARQLAQVRTELAWLEATDELIARFDNGKDARHG